MTQENYDVIVVGAGASGLIAAGRAAEHGAKVLLIEKMERPARKLLITGKGRCNITNEASISEFFKRMRPNGRFLKHAFSEFFNQDIIDLLSKHGVETNTERGGRIFPQSEKASDVANALISWINNQNVETRYKCKLNRLLIEDRKIRGVNVSLNNKEEELYAQSVILCVGGASYPATGSNGEGYKIAKYAGHKIEAVRPALVPLETEGELAEQLQGLSLKNANIIVWINGKKKTEEFGEMLFTHFGLSGPVILTISRMVVDELRMNNSVEISIDLKPALDEQKLDNRLLRDLNENGKKRIDNIFKQWLPAKLIPVFLDLCNIDPSKEGHQLNAKERRKIRILLKDLRFKISGHRSFSEAIITAGGINTNEIDSKTMESKLVTGLYFAGELIDLDADTGGYNLQIAWSTGWLAGQSSVEIDM